MGRDTFGEDVYWYYESDGGKTCGGGRIVHTPKTHYLVKNLERIDCKSKKDALKKLKELNDVIKGDNNEQYDEPVLHQRV